MHTFTLKLLSWWKDLKYSATAEKIKELRRRCQLFIVSSFLCFSLGFGQVLKVEAHPGAIAGSTVSTIMLTRTRNEAASGGNPNIQGVSERGVPYMGIRVPKNVADKASRREEISMVSMAASDTSSAAVLVGGSENSSEQDGVGKIRSRATVDSESSAKNDRGFTSSSRNQKNSAFGVVELKEAEKEVKESLYGLADFMKGR